MALNFNLVICSASSNNKTNARDKVHPTKFKLLALLNIYANFKDVHHKSVYSVITDHIFGPEIRYFGISQGRLGERRSKITNSVISSWNQWRAGFCVSREAKWYFSAPPPECHKCAMHDGSG